MANPSSDNRIQQSCWTLPCFSTMEAHAVTSHVPSNAALERRSEAQDPNLSIVGLELTSVGILPSQTGSNRFARNLNDSQKPLSSPKKRHRVSPAYSALSGDELNRRVAPIGVSTTINTLESSAAPYLYTPYLPSYQCSPNEHFTKWQSSTEMHAPTPYYVANTSVSHFTDQISPLLIMRNQETFSPIDTNAISPADFGSQSSQWSFDSWSNCPTPQAISYFHFRCAEEVKAEIKTEEQSFQQAHITDTPKRPSPKKDRRNIDTSKSCPRLASPEFFAEYLPEKRGFECNVCDRVFDRNSNLKCHRRTHEKVRMSLVCETEGCTKTFNRRADMTRHIKTVDSPR